MITPFRWHGVVETRNFFQTVPVDTLGPDVEVDTASAITFYKPPVTAVLQAADASYFGRVYLDWAAFPYAQQTVMGDGNYLVGFQDLRYTYPGTRHAPLGGFVLLSPELHVLAEGMNSIRSAPAQGREQVPER
jgi:inner membrane protein